MTPERKKSYEEALKLYGAAGVVMDFEEQDKAKAKLESLIAAIEADAVAEVVKNGCECPEKCPHVLTVDEDRNKATLELMEAQKNKCVYWLGIDAAGNTPCFTRTKPECTTCARKE
jgi:hypothetical protein